MLSILFQEGRSSLNCASNDPILLRWMYELVGEQEILPHKRTVLGVLQEKKNFGIIYKEQITCPSA